MAQRQDDFSPTVTNVVAANPDTDTIANSILSIGDQLGQASAQSKALKATAQTQIQFRALDAQFRQKYTDDPTNQQGLQDLQQARKDVVDTNSDNVPTTTTRAYQNKAIELGQQSDASNELWAGKQQARNAVNNVNNAQQTYLLAANASGKDFAANGGGDINDALGFMQANSAIQTFASPIIGADKTGALLKNFNSNYVKSFISGVSESHPELAAQLLDNPQIQTHFTTQDIGDMNDLIKKTQKQQQLNQSLQNVGANADLQNTINDPKLGYFEKRIAIDQGEAAGTITPSQAANSRRIIKDASDIDRQTDTPVMADIITKVYDLNENTGLKPSEYLSGVKDLQEDITTKQAGGFITSPDAVKLNKEISTLTQKRTADSTRSVGSHFGDVNKMFNVLPPQYRGTATRQLFYNSTGQNLTQSQLQDQANTIIDGINKQRRSDALAVVARTTNDDTFLQATGYTRDQVTQTAKNRGISESQVIQSLRQKYAGPTRKKTIIGPAQDDKGSDGAIQLNGPNPNADIPEEDDTDQ